MKLLVFQKLQNYGNGKEKMSKKKIGRENIIKIKEEVDRIRSRLCDIIKYSEGYKDPLDDLIYSRRELDTLDKLKKAEKEIEELKSINEHLRKIYKRDLKKELKKQMEKKEMKTKEIIGIVLLIIIGTIIVVAPAVLFTESLRSLYSYEHSTFKIYLITQSIWIFVVFFLAIALQDNSKPFH